MYFIILIGIILTLIIVLKKESLFRRFLIKAVGVIIVSSMIFVLIVFGMKQIENKSVALNQNVAIEHNKKQEIVVIDNKTIFENALKKIMIEFTYFAKGKKLSSFDEDSGPIVVNARILNYSNLTINQTVIKYSIQDCKEEVCIVVDEGRVKVNKEIPINQARDVRFSIGQNKGFSIYGKLNVLLNIEKINQ